MLGCIAKQESAQTQSLCLVCLQFHVDVISSQMDGGHLKTPSLGMNDFIGVFFFSQQQSGLK